MASGGDLPHDLYTFVIEDALGIEYGFWGCVAAGATFKTLGRKRTPQGKAVIARHLEDLDSEHGTHGNRQFYLATQPSQFAPIVAQLGGVGLDHEQHDWGWRRVVIEKPFGHDLE